LYKNVEGEALLAQVHKDQAIYLFVSAPALP